MQRERTSVFQLSVAGVKLVWEILIVRRASASALEWLPHSIQCKEHVQEYRIGCRNAWQLRHNKA